MANLEMKIPMKFTVEEQQAKLALFMVETYINNSSENIVQEQQMDGTIKLSFDNVNVVNSDKVQRILHCLHDLGGCDAKDEFGRGWDNAIDAAIDEVEGLTGVKLDFDEEVE